MMENIYNAAITYLPYVFCLELLPDKGVAVCVTFYLLISTAVASISALYSSETFMRVMYFVIYILASTGAAVYINFYMRDSKSNSEEDIKKAYYKKKGADALNETKDPITGQKQDKQ